MRPRVVAVDFDGTLAGYEHGWQGPPAEDPTRGAGTALQTLVAKGYTVVVFSCRADTPRGVDDIRQWLLRHNMLQFVSDITAMKPRAAAYVDDRAVPFAGNWFAAVRAVDALARKEDEGRIET